METAKRVANETDDNQRHRDRTLPTAVSIGRFRDGRCRWHSNERGDPFSGQPFEQRSGVASAPFQIRLDVCERERCDDPGGGELLF